MELTNKGIEGKPIGGKDTMAHQEARNNNARALFENCLVYMAEHSLWGGETLQKKFTPLQKLALLRYVFNLEQNKVLREQFNQADLEEADIEEMQNLYQNTVVQIMTTLRAGVHGIRDYSNEATELAQLEESIFQERKLAGSTLAHPQQPFNPEVLVFWNVWRQGGFETEDAVTARVTEELKQQRAQELQVT